MSTRKFHFAVLLAVAGGAILAAGCGHRFDPAQVPVITVGKGLRPSISFTPAEAYVLSVYEGSKDGDGIGVIWSASVGGGYENRLRSPVMYGVPPAGSEVRDAPPLTAGKTYTVTVNRKDPLGTGDGFSSTHRKYIGLSTFVAAE